MELIRLGTVKVGNYGSAEELKKALMEKGIFIESYTEHMFNGLVLVPNEAEIDLVMVSAEDLGFEDRDRCDILMGEVVARGEREGLKRCPAEVGAQILLQLSNLPIEDYLVITMDPIPDGDGDQSAFLICSWELNGLSSTYDVDRSDIEYDSFVFMLPRHVSMPNPEKACA
jgi:hypothetical protein